MLRHISSSTTPAGIFACKLQIRVSAISVRRSTSITGDTVTHRRRRTRQRCSFFTTTTTSNSRSNNDKASALEPSPVLTAAWPLLQERFESLKNADGVFPLLTRAQEARFEAAQATRENKKKKKEMASLDIHKEAAAAAAHLEPEADREAAVLMIVCSVNGQPGVLYTKRAAHMFLHGGEISFPGGHFDDTCATSNGRGDKNLLDTALREAHEELQPLLSLLQPPHLTVLGQTSRIPSLKGTPVTPFLAVLWPNLIVAAASDDKVDNDDNDVDDNASSFGDATTTITTTTATTTTHDGIPSLSLEDYFDGDPKEVAAVFFVSLADLVRSETTHVLPVNRFGVTVAPCFPVAGQGNLWGLTAYITQPVLHRLLRPVFIEVSKSR